MIGKLKFKSIFSTISLVVLMIALLPACGTDETTPGIRNDFTLAGSVSTKLDIILALDESTSASFRDKAELQRGVANFIRGLVQSREDWRVRAVAVSLNNANRRSNIWQSEPERLPSGDIDLNKVIPSQYLIDGNGDGFSEMSEVYDLVDWHNPNQASQGEPGLNNIISFLNGFVQQSDFLRGDAQLSIVVFSNGNDMSETRNLGGQLYPAATVGGGILSSIANIKNEPEYVRFYSLVYPGDTTGKPLLGRACNGQNAWPGTRYLQVQNYFEDITRDAARDQGIPQLTGFNIPDLNICAQGSFDNALRSVSNNIWPIIKSRFNRAVTYCRPSHVNLDALASVTVRVNGEILDKDPAKCQDELTGISDPECQGWVYEGWRVDGPNSRISPEIGEPLPAGHIIRFNGNGQFFTGDRVDISC